jgi:hypothetical protein
LQPSWCPERDKAGRNTICATTNAIGADLDVKMAIAAIPEGEWKMFRDGEIAKEVHCMNRFVPGQRRVLCHRCAGLQLIPRLSRRGARQGVGRSQVQTVRWRLFQTGGKIVHQLKINAAMLEMFSAIRERCARFMPEGGEVAALTRQILKASPIAESC